MKKIITVKSKVNKSKLVRLRKLLRENILDIMKEAEATEDPKLTDLKKKIKGLKNIINNPSFPADKKDAVKKTIQKLEASLTDAVLASTSGEAAKAKDSAKKDIKSEVTIQESEDDSEKLSEVIKFVEYFIKHPSEVKVPGMLSKLKIALPKLKAVLQSKGDINVTKDNLGKIGLNI